MTVHEHTSQFGWEGDGGLGDRLIAQIIAGAKTATCAPKASYSAGEWEALQGTVGHLVTVTDRLGTPQCNIRMLAVFETTFGHPDPRLVSGEGHGDDDESFKVANAKAWGGLEADGQPLSDGSVLVAEIFELVEVAS